MATRYEVEVTVVSARKLKNVNWRHGDLRPYVVLWVDAAAKCSTKIAVNGDSDGEDPLWDEKLTLVLPPGCSLDAAALFLDVVHASAEAGTKPLIGSGRLPLREFVDEAGLGATASRTIKLKRPSGRPQGKIEVKIAVRDPARHRDLPPPGTGGYAPPYGQQSRDFGYGYSPYPAPPPTSGGYPYAAAPPPSGYNPYGVPPPMVAGYGQPSAYGPPPYGAATEEGKKKGKFGMGTGLAVGAAAGLLGGLAIAEGVDYVGDKIADDAAEKVEADLGYGDDF